MSAHSNFKKDNCWSCEYFSGERKYDKGVFLGPSVYTGIKGKCSNTRSEKRNSQVFETGWCSKYQKWGVLQSALAIEEQKKETQRVMNELKKKEAESRMSSYSETERELTPSERAEIERDRELRRIRDEQEEKERLAREKQAKINAIKRLPIVSGIVGGVATLLAFLLGWIPYWYWDSRLSSLREMILFLKDTGHDPNEAIVVELYQDGLHAKEMRNSVVWIPFVLLVAGIAITVAVTIYVNKKKVIRLKEAHKE